MQPTNEQLRRAANVVRGLAMDAVQQANSGHPGMPMGMADVAVTIWLQHLRYDVSDPAWRGRDRFVLSAGHGSMLQYALLHLAGFGLTSEDLQQFRQLGSRTPGHPELGDTPGVETTTGPLGQGFANGVGMALAARIEAARFDCPLADRHRIVGIVSDGDLMEGLSHEAASLAGHLQLSNLVYCYDHNHITIDGSTEQAFTEDVARRFQAYGWRVLELPDAHDTQAVREVIDNAFDEGADRPTLVICRTHIGFGSPKKQGTAAAHGAPLGEEEVLATKHALELPADQTFWVSDEVRTLFRRAATAKAQHAQQWHDAFTAWQQSHPDLADRHAAFLRRALPADLLEQLCAAVEGETKAATRALSGTVIQRAAELVPSLIGGSADLATSCKTTIEASDAVEPGDYGRRNINFGVREHAMAGIVNGLALHGGFLPMGSTFLVFSDYLRPSLRLAAVMGLRAIYLFTHDSICVGEDGPTHQPIEHVSALRLIPNLHVVRPADGLEVAAAWTCALTRQQGPTALVLTRQKLTALQRPADFQPDHLLKGGYVVRDTAPGQAVATVCASGSEVATVVAAAEQLAADGVHLRVASIPCLEAFLDQPRRWRRQVLPKNLPVLAVELGRPELWCQLTGSLDHVIGLSRYGRSAPQEALLEDFGFTADALAEQLRSLIAP